MTFGDRKNMKMRQLYILRYMWCGIVGIKTSICGLLHKLMMFVLWFDINLYENEQIFNIFEFGRHVSGWWKHKFVRWQLIII